jgi:hypothetical protein
MTTFLLWMDVISLLGRVRTITGCAGFNFFRIIFEHMSLITVISIYLIIDEKLILHNVYYFSAENVICVR